MKEPDFKPHALVMSIKHNQPGSLAICEESMKFGYTLALRHITDDLSKVKDELIAARNKANAQQ
jgi:hypothetical protein